MFVLTGTSVLDGSTVTITTDDPFGIMDSCGWEFTLDAVDLAEGRW